MGVAVTVAVGVTVGVGGAPLGKQAENSEVLSTTSVAVAVKMVSPGGIAYGTGPKTAVQLAFVVTMVKPRYVRPWPLPDGSHAAFESNPAWGRSCWLR